MNRLIGVNHPMGPVSDPKPRHRGSGWDIPRAIETDVEHIRCTSARREIDIGEFTAEDKAPPVGCRRQRRANGHRRNQPHDACETRRQDTSQDNGAHQRPDRDSAHLGENPIDAEATPRCERCSEKGGAHEPRHPSETTISFASGVTEGANNQSHQQHNPGRRR